MSEQDATEEESPDEHGETGEDAGADGVDSSDSDDLDEFAEAPDGDADAALSAIIGSTQDVDETDAGDSLFDDEAVTVEDDLLDRIERASPETTAQAVAMLQSRVETLESELADREEDIDDLESRLARKQADFQNYKKRQQKRMEEEKQRATEDLVSRLVDVRDNLKRALDQEEGTDIRGGVESTLKQFDDELDKENVTPVEPEPGDEVDPQRHEALATIASDQPEGTVAQVHRDGYEMAGKVIRTAQVAVSDGSGHEE